MREVRERNLSLAPTFGVKVFPKAFHLLKSDELLETTAALRLIQKTQKSHSGFLAPWATKPRRGLGRYSADHLQQEEIQ